MWKALGRTGEAVGRDRVKRLMRRPRHPERQAPRRAVAYHHARPRGPPSFERNFNAQRPDRLWVADFTYLHCCEGVVFFSFVIDVFSRRVVG